MRVADGAEIKTDKETAHRCQGIDDHRIQHDGFEIGCDIAPETLRRLGVLFFLQHVCLPWRGVAPLPLRGMLTSFAARGQRGAFG